MSSANCRLVIFLLPMRIQNAVKNAKEDCTGAQCEEIETCLNKNNSKRAYQPVKDLTSGKQGCSSTIQCWKRPVAGWPNAPNFCLGPPEISKLWTLVAQKFLSGNNK